MGQSLINLKEDVSFFYLRINLGLTRDIPILKMKRNQTGSNVRGSKPVTVYFQKYEDKEEILR